MLSSIRKLIFRNYLQRRDQVLTKLAAVEGRLRLPQGELDRTHAAALMAILEHAFHHVPYYAEQAELRRFLEHGRFDPTLFQSIPLLDKQIIRDRFEDLQSTLRPRVGWYKNSSGGSTGVPITFYQDRAYGNQNLLTTLLFDTWTGTRPGDPRLVFWGSERDLKHQAASFADRVLTWAEQKRMYNTFCLTPDLMGSALEAIRRRPPAQILGYVESVYQIARHVNQDKIVLPPVKAVLTSAGTLLPVMREAIEQAFRGPVFNRYGSREVGAIACECSEHQGLHVAYESLHVEILREDGSPADPGEEGEIVVTQLANLPMPLIRYRIGDRGFLLDGPCACGRTWPRLGAVSGRVSDQFRTRDGRLVHGNFICYLMYFSEWIERYQFVQKALDHVVLRVQPHTWSDDLSFRPAGFEREVVEYIQEGMGHDMRVEFEYAPRLEAGASGKFRYVLCELEEDA